MACSISPLSYSSSLGYHRHMHSFPTRRSSDLEVDVAERRSRRGVEEHDLAAVQCDVERPDRKSTRLNSSHGYISYAVFCLKKKIFRRVEYVLFLNLSCLAATCSGITACLSVIS